MALFSTRTHGILDYFTAGTLVALPRLLGWDKRITRLLTASGVGTVVYSLLTRYELGLVKVIPMRGHLLIDAVSGTAFCAAPLIFQDQDWSVLGPLVGIGVFEIMASVTTDPEPPLSERAGELLDATT